jgi:enterochelin esterase family protein
MPVVPALLTALLAIATQTPAQGPFGPRPPAFDSPEVSDDRTITFRIHAPDAEEVRLVSNDLPDIRFGVDTERTDEGVWEATVGPVPAGAYRYSFDVDGVSVIDPRNTATSETNSSVMSLVTVPGSDLFDLKDVPHGAVARVDYYSRTLERFRRMHVYTPPGYENGDGEFPVLYLLHGALDCDAAWSTVGRAGQILDNLIAAGQARPMIVVMPDGHTGPFRFGPGGGDSFSRQMEEFRDDFVTDVKPFVEEHYRVIGDRDHRAIAGLSMGGAQTLDIAFDNLAEYGYVGVFSSGIFGISGGFGGEAPSTEWEDGRRDVLDDADLKQDLRLVWFATGSEDFMRRMSADTVAMLESHEIDVTYNETGGGHTWLNWRDYLGEFAPLLFTD